MFKKSSKKETLSKFDEDLFRVNKSTKTLIHKATPLHDKLRMKLPWYYKWHLNPMSRSVHWASLALAIISAGLMVAPFLTHKEVGQSLAASTKTWDSGSEFNDFELTNISLNGLAGNLSLAALSGGYTFDKYIGSQGDGDDQFRAGQQAPNSMCMSDNYIYAIDNDVYAIKVFNLDGTFQKKISTSGSLITGWPIRSCSVAPNGNLYMIYNHWVNGTPGGGDGMEEGIIAIDPAAETVVTSWGGEGTADGKFGGSTYGIVVSPDNEVFVTDSFSNRMQVFDLSGNFLRKSGITPSDGRLAWGPNDEIYYPTVNGVEVFDKDGLLLRTLTTVPFSNYIAVDSNNNLHIPSNYKVDVYNGTSADLIGSYGAGVQGTGDGEFDTFTGVGADSAGNSYVSDGVKNNISKFTFAPASFNSSGSATYTYTPIDASTSVNWDSATPSITLSGQTATVSYAVSGTGTYSTDISTLANSASLYIKIELAGDGTATPIVNSLAVNYSDADPTPVAPTITSISPTSGPVGTTVTVTGTNFGASQGAATISIGASPAAVTSWSDTSIVVTVPAGAALGAGSCAVSTAGGSATISFTVTTTPVAPEISAVSFSPSSGFVGIGGTITMTITADMTGLTLGTTTINSKSVAGFTEIGGNQYSVTYTVASGDAEWADSEQIPISTILCNGAACNSAFATSPAANVSPAVDANAPVLAIVSDVSANPSSLQPEFQFSATDNETIAAAPFEFTGGCSTLTLGASVGPASPVNAINLAMSPDNSDFTPGTYSCTLKIKDQADNESNTLTINSFTIAAPSAPETPTGVVIDIAEVMETDQYVLSWSASSGATTYDISELSVGTSVTDCSVIGTSSYSAVASDVVGTSYTVDLSGDQTNTKHCAYVIAKNAAGSSSPGYAAPKYTRAAAPSMPTVVTRSWETTPVLYSLNTVLNTAGNPAYTDFAVKMTPEGGSDAWLQTNGSNSGSQSWETYSGWNTTSGVNATGLPDGDKNYTISAIARNGDGVLTDYSTSTTIRTAPAKVINFAGLPTVPYRLDFQIAWAWALNSTAPDNYLLTDASEGVCGATYQTLDNLTNQVNETPLTDNTRVERCLIAQRGTALGEPAWKSEYTNIKTPTGITATSIGSASITLQATGSFTGLGVGSAGLVFQETTGQGGGVGDGFGSTVIGTTITDTGLSPNTAYTYRVSGRNSIDYATAETSAVSFTTAPLSASIESSTPQSWNSTDKYSFKIIVNPGGNPDAIQYAIKAEYDDTSEWLTPSGGTSETETWGYYTADWGSTDGFVFKGISSGDKNYTFKVKAKNVSTETALSAGVTAMTAASKVQNVNHNHNDLANKQQSINWTWSANTVDPDGYFVSEYASGACVLNSKATVTATTGLENSLTANTKYTRCIVGYRMSGALRIFGEPSDSYSAYTAVNDPTGIDISNVADRTATLGVKVADILGSLAGDQSGLCISTTGTCSGTSETPALDKWYQGAAGINISALSPNNEYTYQIKARNGDGEESATASTSFWTLPIKPALTLTSLNWIQLSEYHLTASIVMPNYNPLTTKYCYQISTAAEMTAPNIQPATCDTANDALWTTDIVKNFGSLLANQQYWIRVTAKNGEDETVISDVVDQVTPPAQPVNPSGSACIGSVDDDTSSTATLSWDGVVNAVSYAVYYRLGSSGNFTTVSVADNSTTISSLTNYSAYQWKVAGVDAGGRSGQPTTTQSFNTNSTCPIQPPADFQGSALSTSSIRWIWQPSTGATGYRLHDSLDAIKSGATPIAQGVGTRSYDETGLSVNTQYNRHANAFNTANNIDSGADSVYTLANSPGATTIGSGDIGTSTIKFVINRNSNPVETRFYIKVVSSTPADTAANDKYIVPGSGDPIAATATGIGTEWHRYDTEWGGTDGVVIGGLKSRTAYTFEVGAENGDNIATTTVSATATTKSDRKIWDGGGTTNNWSEALNWTDDIVPIGTEAVYFMDITTKAAIVDSIGSWADFGTMIIDGYTGTITDTAIDLKLASFSQNSGSFTNSKTFEAKSFSQSGGTFDSAAGTFTAGDLDVLGGNFSAPSGHGFYFRAYDDGLSNSYKLNIANEVNFTQGATDIVYFMANKSHVRKVTGKPLINAWILRDDDIAEAVTISFDDSAFTVSNDLTFKNETAKSVIVTKMITTVKGKLLAPQTPETGITQIGGVPSESVTIDLYGDLTLSDLGIDFNANLNLVGDSSDQAVKIENDAKLHNTNWTMKKAGGATVKKDVTAQSDLNFQCSLDCKFKIDDGTFKLNGKKLRIVNFEQNGGNFDGGSLGGGLTVGDLIFNAGSFYAPDLAAYDPNIQNRNGAITMIDFPEVPTHGNYKTVIASYPARYYEASFANMVYSIQKSHVREVRFTKNNISKTFFDRTVVNADDQEPRLTIVNLASGSNPAVQSQDLYIQNQTNKDYKITNLWGSARDITFPQTSAFSGKVILDETVANKAKLEVMENWDNKEDVTYIDSEKQIVLQNEVSFTDAMSYSMSKIKGSNKFKNFTVTEAGKTIQFEANKGQVVTGKLKIAGANDKKVVMKALVDPDCSASGTTALPIVSCQTAAPSAECKPAAYKPTYWVIVLEQAPEISHASISSSYNLSEKVPEIVATNSVDNCPEVNVGWKFIQTLPATISQFERVKTLVLNSISSIVDFAKRVVAF